MAFGIYSFTSKIVNIFSDNNATGTTYYLGNGLASPIKQIELRYYENKPQINTMFPAIFISPKSKTDEFSHIGNNAKRKMKIQVDIVGIVQDGYGQINGRAKSDQNMLLLSRNIENLLRNKITLSQTVVTQSLIQNIEYDAIDYTDTYNSICKFSLVCDVLSD